MGAVVAVKPRWCGGVAAAALAFGGTRHWSRQARARPARAVTIGRPRRFPIAKNVAVVLLQGAATGALLTELLFRQELGTLCESCCAHEYRTVASPQQWALCLVIGVVLCGTGLRLPAAARRRLGIFP